MAQDMEERRPDILVEVNGIHKSFPGVQALSDVSLQIRRGEIHAVVGENGAGKSTLMNILSGVFTADRGQILVDGQEVVIATPKQAHALGIHTVHQETSLCPNLSVAENAFVYDIPTRGPGLVDRHRLTAETQELLTMFDLKVRPDTLVRDLGVAQQQLVEIAKAFAGKCRVLILDEPTSALALHEEALLFDRVRRLREQGASVVYISHKLREVFELADRVTVLRDGRVIGTRVVAETDIPGIVTMMVGRELSQLYPEKGKISGKPVLQVRHLASGRQVRDVSFDLHAGEILGVAGLVGAGRTEMAMAIFGVAPVDKGEVLVDGKRLEPEAPQKAISLGLGLLHESRREWGLFLLKDVQANIISAHLGDFSRGPLMDSRKEQAEARRMVEALRIRTPSLLQKVMNLSGGNQQKVVVGKWLSTRPRILLVDEPTRGIDVGAKADIHALLRSLANEGVAILMISSELPEILGMSDRVLVMHEGRTVGTLSAEEASESAIMSLAVGS
jgi:ribose transport system ATP-binding protein